MFKKAKEKIVNAIEWINKKVNIGYNDYYEVTPNFGFALEGTY